MIPARPNVRLAIWLRIGTAALLAATVACASTQLQSTWVRPHTGPLNFHKVVALALSKTPARRRIMEDAMVQEIRRVSNVPTVASYTLISDADVTNERRVREEIDRAGFDGGVLLRVTDVTHVDVFVPSRTRHAPEHYQTIWNYFGYWAPILNEPGYVERQTLVQIETEVYSTAGDGDLVYAAVSRTLNPTSARDLVKDVGQVVSKDLIAKGLLRQVR